jgi:small subunit ribosomal protein S1
MEFEREEIEKLYAETFLGIEVGSMIEGRIINIKEEGVIVDIGYKSEGFIPKEEFLFDELTELKVGAAIEVYVDAMVDSEGMVRLSKEKASKIRAWDTIETCFSRSIPIEGKITGKTKGGMFVSIQGVNAFLPGSQIDIKMIRETEELIGKKMNFKILKLSNKRTNLIVSRRQLLEEERQHKKTETLKNLTEGALLKGIVKNITDYGVFVDLGGIDGLLHISDISWGRITHPSEFFVLGDEIEVLVLKYDGSTEKVTLGYKQKRPDPWESVEEKYPAGSRIKGEVVSITDYGAFIKIEDGLEGLVHISELDWSPKPKHPSKYLSIGETVETLVLNVDKVNRRLSLSIKQVRPSPWQLVSERYRAGQALRGKVTGITDFGVFIGLPEGVDGLVHISDISWTKHLKHPSEVIRKGQTLDAVVLNIEPEKERISLGIKQLTPDPWLDEIPGKFKLGDELRCKALRITDFGIFVELEGGVDGLIYSSEIVSGDEPLTEGNELRARIIKIDYDSRKIGLSMKNISSETE